MTMEEESKVYFKNNAEAWQHNAYLLGNYNYSVPLNRFRVIKKILAQRSDIKSILDIGCGGAYLSIELAKLGFYVTSIDQSQEMLNLARKNIENESKEVREKITLKYGSVNDYNTTDRYDCVIAMGLIGYLDSDEKLFQFVKKILRKNGILMVSFRNHLFNLFSISHRTILDVKQGSFEKLIDEASKLYKRVSVGKTVEFLKAMNTITNELLSSSLSYNTNICEESMPYSQHIEPRQTTPKQAQECAEGCGYHVEKFVGIHPHFSVPGLNKNLPMEVYNKISDALIPFEDEDIALLWSSVFICIFKNL